MCDVLLLNISENKEGEDEFCQRVAEGLSMPVDYKMLRAEQMASYEFWNSLNYSLIILVGHGRREGTFVTGQSIIYSGFSDIGELIVADEVYDYLDEPDKILPQLSPNKRPY